MNGSKQSITTQKILKCISRHLSSRKECQNIEYTVSINSTPFNDYEITMYPYITVFPNTHNRKESDRENIIHHVIYSHFHEIFEYSNGSYTHIKENSVVTGTYTYKKFKFTNRRKWQKIEQGDQLVHGSKMGRYKN